MVRSKTWGTLSVALALVAPTACGDRTAQGNSTLAEIDSSNSQPIGESMEVRVLAALRQQHQYLNHAQQRLVTARR
jgi:hypothetical protein